MESVYGSLPLDVQELIGPCMGRIPEVLDLIIKGWDVILKAREKQGRERSAEVKRGEELVRAAQRLLAGAIDCWQGAQREFIVRGGRRDKEMRSQPPRKPAPVPPRKAPPACTPAVLQSLTGYTLIRVTGRNMEFAMDFVEPLSTTPTANELRDYPVVSSGGYTADGTIPVGPLFIHDIDNVGAPAVWKDAKPRGKPRQGKVIELSGRGGVWILRNNSVLVQRQGGLLPGHILSRGETRSFMGGGAMLIENREKIEDPDLINRQAFFDKDKDGGRGGYESAQLQSGAHRIMIGDCNGTVYWIATPVVTAMAARDALHEAGFNDLVSFDGGNGAFYYRNGRKVFSGRNGEATNVQRILIYTR